MSSSLFFLSLVALVVFPRLPSLTFPLPPNSSISSFLLPFSHSLLFPLPHLRILLSLLPSIPSLNSPLLFLFFPSLIVPLPISMYILRVSNLSPSLQMGEGTSVSPCLVVDSSRMSTKSLSSLSSHLPCAFCLQGPTTVSDLTSPPDLDEATRERLREHLIQSHSSAVSKAFLHPNPSDDTHLWLMTCADYAVPSPEGGEATTANLDDVISALLAQGEEMETVKEENEEKRKGLKRKAKDELMESYDGEVTMNDWSHPTDPSSYFLNATVLASGLAKGEEGGEGEGNTPPTSTTLVDDDRICHLCWEESRYPGRHIAQKHLKKPLYECPVCEGFGSYEGCTVQKHIHKVHPDSDALPISNLEKYADEIRDLQSRCFPNRPMKLVRNVHSSRPRERHHCKLCNTQVAQSDRQRHVYHKHLCKDRVFECPLCSFHSNYDVHRVKWHIKWIHKEEAANVEPISHENDYRDEIDALNEDCFPGWQHRRKPFWWLENDEAAARIEAVKEKEKDTVAAPPSKILKMSPPLVDSPNPSPDSKTKEGNEWTCQLCFREFKPSSNFLRHVAKEHMTIPLYQCPVCEGQGAQDAYEIRAHMLKVHGSADMAPLSNIEKHADEIQEIYQACFPGRKLKCLQQMHTSTLSSNTRSPPKIGTTTVKKKEVEKKKVTVEDTVVPVVSTVESTTSTTKSTREEDKVTCQMCFQEMKTEDRQIHVYRHHLKEPRLYECPLCDFSHHACSSDVRSHIKYTHRDQPDVMPRANLLEHSEKIAEWNEKCFPGWINRRLPSAALEDFNRCRLCDEEVRQTSRHIAEVHLKIPLHQCPLCEYGAAESRLVKRHMNNNHKKKEAKGLEPIANVVERRADFSSVHDRCFPGRPKRLSNITISDEGRRAKCRLCGGTFSRKKRMAHILETHIAKPVFRCSECSFHSTHDEEVVAVHVRDVHDGDAATISELKEIEPTVLSTGRQCFPDWTPSAEEMAGSV